MKIKLIYGPIHVIEEMTNVFIERKKIISISTEMYTKGEAPFMAVTVVYED